MISIIEDTSFIVAVLDAGDIFYEDAWKTLEVFSPFLDKVRIIIPSVMLLETTTTLLKKGLSKSRVEEKLWKLLHRKEVMVVDIPANLFIKLPYASFTVRELKTYDLVLGTLGFEYSALILTFDKKIREKVKGIYPAIYYCSSKGDTKNESELFVEDLKKRTKKF